MKPRLIVLIDFSPYTPTLLKFAGAWSEKSESEILLIHQLFSPEVVERNGGKPESILQQEKNHYKTCSDLFVTALPQVSFN